jgi:hypothetical protein
MLPGISSCGEESLQIIRETNGVMGISKRTGCGPFLKNQKHLKEEETEINKGYLKEFSEFKVKLIVNGIYYIKLELNTMEHANTVKLCMMAKDRISVAYWDFDIPLLPESAAITSRLLE